MNKIAIYALSATLAIVAQPVAAAVVVSGSGTISNTDSTQTNRLSRDGNSSTWASTKPFPGTIAQSPTYYDLVTGTFASNAVQTIFYEITYSTAAVNGLPFSVAYQNSFVPTNLMTNYIGDAGSSPLAAGSPVTYQVIVAAGSQLLVNFHNVVAVPVDYAYTISAFSDANRGENFLSVTPSVPEPATWAMMIFGLGAVGYAMRSAKRRSDQKFDAKIKHIASGALA